MKLPWYVDMLNINLDNYDLNEAKRRIKLLADALHQGWDSDHGKPRLRQ